MSETPMRRFSSLGRRRAVLAFLAALLAVGGAQAIPWAAATTSSGDRAIFEPLTAARLLDTRSTSNPVGPAESRVLQVTGAGGVPADATAVALNVTAVTPTRGGYLTVYPADATRPTASNVNFAAAQTVANAVTVKLGAGGTNAGKIRIFNSSGSTHVIVDVAGYFRGHTHDDRYYTKAQAQGRLAGNSLTCPAGQFLNTVAADGTPTCGVGTPGPAGPKNWASLTPENLPASGSDFYRFVTPSFVVPADVTSCLVTSTVQMQPPDVAPNDTLFLRNAVQRNGVNSEDGQYGHFLTNDGLNGKQPSVSRTSVLAVTPGQTVAFGVYFGGLEGGWYDSPFAASTSYLCS